MGSPCPHDLQTPKASTRHAKMSRTESCLPDAWFQTVMLKFRKNYVNHFPSLRITVLTVNKRIFKSSNKEMFSKYMMS